jgi:hypothetical protein
MVAPGAFRVELPMTLPLATPEATVPELGRVAQVRSLYPVRVRLRDSSEITIRPIGPQDAQREQAFCTGALPTDTLLPLHEHVARASA